MPNSATFSRLVEMRGEMIADRLLAEPMREPGARGGRVGHRLRGGEGLGGDEEQRALGVEAGQRVGEMRAVDIGDEVHARAVAAIGRERRDRHGRAEIGAADADIDDVGRSGRRPRRGSRRSGPASAKAQKAVEHRVHVRHDVLRRRRGDRRPRGARSATCRTARSSVMLIGSPANIASRKLGDVGRLGKRDEQRHRLGDDAVLRVVERQVAEREREAREAVRVGGEEVAQMRVAHRGAMRAELFQRCEGRRLHAALPQAGGLARQRPRCAPSRRAATASFGATQEPPTQTTFGSAR